MSQAAVAQKHKTEHPMTQITLSVKCVICSNDGTVFKKDKQK